MARVEQFVLRWSGYFHTTLTEMDTSWVPLAIDSGVLGAVVRCQRKRHLEFINSSMGALAISSTNLLLYPWIRGPLLPPLDPRIYLVILIASSIK